MHVTDLVWIVTLVILVAVLLFDVFVIGRKPHEPTTKECAIILGVYVGLALLFALFVGWHWGAVYGGEFIQGWLTEYSLSIDNLFVFLIIMTKMRVPRQLQQYALMVGIILALIFRGVFIALGAALIAEFAWVFFIFGAFLIYTAISLVKEYFSKQEEAEPTDNFLIRFVKKKFHFSDEFHGTKLRVKHEGRHLMTPMFLVIVALGSTDLMFALDSIPAVYGQTQQAYLVFTVNVFALMGLRQLYFLIGGLLKRLVYLSIGLSVLLAFIGVKLVLHALHEYHVLGWEMPMWMSMGAIVVILAVTTVASLVKSSRTPTEETSED